MDGCEWGDQEIPHSTAQEGGKEESCGRVFQVLMVASGGGGGGFQGWLVVTAVLVPSSSSSSLGINDAEAS